MKKSLLVFFLQLSLVAVNAQGWLPDKETGSVYEPDEYGVVEDYDGNVYRTARFGDTWWMLENLRCKHYNDGTAVTSCEEVEAKRPAKTGYYLWFGNVATWAYPDADSTKMEKYGLLYTWNAGADAIENGLNKKPLYTFNCHGGLLPEGWKIADTTAWFNLANRMMSEDEIIGSWVTRNTPSGGIERVFEITSVKDMGLYIKSPVGEGWKESEVLNVVNPEMWNKSELGLVASGSMGGDINSDGEIPVMGIDEYGWYWTDQFVHEDSSGNGKRYIYLAFDTNNLVTRNNATANHGSVRGIKRVEREQVDENDYTKVGNVSASDDFLVYPYKSDAEFVVLSAKETIYKIFSTDGNLIQKGSLKTGVNILNIDTVPSGIYLICIDKLSFKIIKA